MSYYIINSGNSRSFSDATALNAGAAQDAANANVIIIIGTQASQHADNITQWQSKAAVLIELGNECLGVYTGESRGDEGSNVLGFARFGLGNDQPSKLVEVVRQPKSNEAAIAAAKQLFEGLGLQVAVCGDFAGRIINRLVRPYYNAALRRLDEGLATAADLDTTLKLGLGYPEGPITLLERSGLAEHCEVTQALFDAYGDAAYAPARRAQVAKVRRSQ